MLHQSGPEGTGDREYRDVPPARCTTRKGFQALLEPSFKPSSDNVKVSEPAPVGLAPSQLPPFLPNSGNQLGNVSSPASAVNYNQGGSQASPFRGANHVFVLSKNKKPLMPCHPARARELLAKKKAVVHSRFPFTIRLKFRTEGETQALNLKLDPGSKTTGIAIVTQRGKILFGAELNHRGLEIVKKLTARRQARRGRRYRHTWYRQPKFPPGKTGKYDTSRPEGWLSPSLMHRVYTVITWAKRLIKRTPITEIWVERVKFDTHLLRNPDVAGILYQQGTLWGYEVREYLLEAWEHKCAYCDAKDVALEIDHVHPKTKGGVDSIGNLTIACHDCNQAKGSRLLEEFLIHDPKRAAHIREQMLSPLRDAAAINATRYRIVEELQTLGLPVRCFIGGQTKFNRSRLSLSKTHWLDAACVGEIETLWNTGLQPLVITACGRGSRKRTRFTKYGFHQKDGTGRILGILTNKKKSFGFQTGDIVTANVPKGKNKGRHFGRLAMRANGDFNIKTATGTVQHINYKHTRLLQRADGYQYNFGSSTLINQKTITQNTNSTPS